MACSSPMVGVPNPLKAGVAIMHPMEFLKRYCGRQERYFLDANGDLNKVYAIVSEYLYDHKFETYDKLTGKKVYRNAFYIPCGKCLGCRLDYSREWANRCQMEAMLYHENWFLTLTYDDDHLVQGKIFDVYSYTDDGAIFDPHYFNVDHATLVPEHLRNFLKSLRERFARLYSVEDIRFYACGEYGGKTERPHYHVLAFNLPLKHLHIYKSTYRGDLLYNDDDLSAVWLHGFAVAAELNWQTCAYTARYIMKKQTGGKMHEGFYNDRGIYQEFTRASNRPGIASEFYWKNLDEILETDKIVLPPVKGQVHVVSPGRYFEKFIENTGRPDWMEKLSENKDKRRQRSVDKNKDVHFVLQMSDEEYFNKNFEVSERVFKTLSSFRNSIDN